MPGKKLEIPTKRPDGTLMLRRSSVAERLAALSIEERLEVLRGMDDAEFEEVMWDWGFWGRPEQLIPEGDWDFWLLLTGRGWGKTRTGAETVKQWEVDGSGLFHMIGATAADVRDVMVEGPAGLLSVYPDHLRPKYEPSKRRITWPSGAIALLFSADEPDRLRGPQCEKLWADEPAAWRYAERTWANALFGLRLGERPQALLTTTPRPIPMIKDLFEDPRCHVTTGSTYDNAANLAPLFLREILTRYEGTRLGRQEIHAELLLDVPGALWTEELIDKYRWDYGTRYEVLRTCVAIDPSVTSGEDSDETGIVAAHTLHGNRKRPEYVVTHDLSRRGTVDEWATVAIDLYHEVEADIMVGEVNNGGDLVEKVIKDKDSSIHFKQVRASRGKIVRAEPISGLYEQGRVHHLGRFPLMEEQMCSATQDREFLESPDRMDAMVWAITELSNKKVRKWTLVG